MLTYKRQQRDGPFWKRTALKERYDSIKIPTFVIGGWYDGYRDSVPRMLEHLKAPIKAIVGPWHHAYPHDAYPKPQMEWRHEAVRWFDWWLKGRDTGIMAEPRFAVYVQQYHPPGPGLEEVQGRVALRGRLADPSHSPGGVLPAAEPHPRDGDARGRPFTSSATCPRRGSRPAGR